MWTVSLGAMIVPGRLRATLYLKASSDGYGLQKKIVGGAP